MTAVLSVMFPKITRVTLNSFSLYSLEPNISLELGNGVTCLAGANGIGKSTFLATVNYALTGVVPHPRRRFLSAAAYLKDALAFTEGYFSGRISELDRDSAAVSIEFDLRGKSYSLRRGLFESESLQQFSVSTAGQVDFLLDVSSPVEREAKYRMSICKDAGLSSFEQFVFLQHFLLTFDESRHLLFWDEEASAQLLFLCFGGDPQDAARADELNREMERAGSRGRNLQFQANTLTKRINLLERSIEDTADVSPELEEFERLHRENEAEIVELESRLTRAENEFGDHEVRAARYSAEVASLRVEYAKAFDSFVGLHSAPALHPIIRASLEDSICALCHSGGQHVQERIQSALDSGNCPLCGSDLKSADHSMSSVHITEVDRSLGEARDRLEESLSAQARLRGEIEGVRSSLVDARRRLSDLVHDNEGFASHIASRAEAAGEALSQHIRSLDEARSALIEQRDEAYAARDRHRDALRLLQRALESRYALAEETFVPAFRRLAELFLGIDLDVSLIVGAGASMHLQLQMRGDARRDEHQLSESQRFFVDIALRMALAQQIAGSASALLIDTPEGSLDIAYEDRAGRMFAEYVSGGHQILMTANINTSKLLTTMARSCGPGAMKIVKMTGWSELSDVQTQAGDLFAQAFTTISTALAEGGQL